MKFLILASILCIVATEKPHLRQTIPNSYDARAYGLISSIRDQKTCSGSGWAFAAVSLIETAYAKKGQRGLDLSEQQLLCCDLANDACNGGNVGTALSYIQQAGLVTEVQLPYTENRYNCPISSGPYKGTNVTVTPTVQDIKAAILQYGSVAIGVDGQNTIWKFYLGGILTCQSNVVNHYVNLVGWGVSGSTTYWIARNSWGSKWGEKGYFRLAMSGCSYTEAYAAKVE